MLNYTYVFLGYTLSLIIISLWFTLDTKDTLGTKDTKDD